LLKDPVVLLFDAVAGGCGHVFFLHVVFDKGADLGQELCFDFIWNGGCRGVGLREQSTEKKEDGVTASE
jgi:hypothetical protein